VTPVEDPPCRRPRQGGVGDSAPMNARFNLYRRFKNSMRERALVQPCSTNRPVQPHRRPSAPGVYPPRWADTFRLVSSGFTTQEKPPCSPWCDLRTRFRSFPLNFAPPSPASICAHLCSTVDRVQPASGRFKLPQPYSLLYPSKTCVQESTRLGGRNLWFTAAQSAAVPASAGPTSRSRGWRPKKRSRR
jgi:hypothetical protein